MDKFGEADVADVVNGGGLVRCLAGTIYRFATPPAGRRRKVGTANLACEPDALISAAGAVLELERPLKWRDTGFVLRSQRKLQT